MTSLEEIKETFEFIDDWEDRYRFIIDLGRALPEMPLEHRIEENLVRGCQSQVWLLASLNEESNQVELRIDSDAHIVRGLIAIVSAAYAHKTPAQICDFDVDSLFAELELFSHLSMNRGNGLRAMVNRIRAEANELSLSA